MGKLKPIGSEKLEGLEKIQRIMEIARYKENTPNPINEVNSNHYNIKLVDGNTYHIEKEKNGYVIKRTVNEGLLEYIEPMKNRKYYQSYSQAFKRLNLITKEINSLNGNEGGVSLFSEQKKFVLKTPKPDTPPATEPEMPAPAPAPAPAPMGDSGMSPDTGMGEEMPKPTDTGANEPPADDMDLPEPEMDGEEMPSDEENGDDDVVSFKSIQKLTGKLGQKLRKINQGEEPISADDTKYVINSILSALDLSVLSDEDMEEIIGRLEDSEFEGDENDEESDMPPDDMEDEEDLEPAPKEEPLPDGEMSENENKEYFEGMIGGKYDLGFSDKPKGYSSKLKQKMGDMMEDSEYDGVGGIFDSVFSESKVDNIIKSYFVESNSERKFIEEQKQRKFLTEKVSKIKNMREVRNLSESYLQERTADKFLTRYTKAKFIGKTNKNNLVFEVNGRQYKITPDGAIL